jgi:hypothetical protein
VRYVPRYTHVERWMDDGTIDGEIMIDGEMVG